MKKYLYVMGDQDYAALRFEEEYMDQINRLWDESNKAGKMITYGVDGTEFDVIAYELDEATMEVVFKHQDYDHSKHENFIEVVGQK